MSICPDGTLRCRLHSKNQGVNTVTYKLSNGAVFTQQIQKYVCVNRLYEYESSWGKKQTNRKNILFAEADLVAPSEKKFQFVSN